MTDIRHTPDPRNIDIDRVGIKGLLYPIVLRDKQNDTQHTTAEISFYVDLPRQFKGTHMSRFVDILNKFRAKIDLRAIDEILDHARQQFSASTARIELTFPYFIMKSAPVTRSEGLMSYRCTILAETRSEGRSSSTVTVRVPVTSVCPCSKEIADRGAHNQRGIVTLAARTNRFVWIEELITAVERSASYEIFTNLRREDEKFITEHAYDNPAFVEDIVRDVADKLMADPRIDWFSVESENWESLHNHNSYACVEMDLSRLRQQS
jgi:GTP cyclohydrolase I